MTHVLESDGIDPEIAKDWVQSFEGDLTRRMAMPPPPSQDKELREKALMYAVQAYEKSTRIHSVVSVAESFLDFLRGAEA